jgi:hypothetical protein
MVKYLQLFGERCSGTNFVSSLIRKNLANIELTKDFGGKHWFIRNHHPRCRTNQSTDFQCVRPLSDSADTLFLCLFRNPFDWLRSIHARPFHAGNHWGLPFDEFIRKPWHAFETSRLNPTWPERSDGYWFIEEAKNIIRLRTEKVRHLLKLQETVENVCFVNYEVIRDDNEVLRDIAERFRIKLKHNQIRGEPKYLGRPKDVEFAPRKYPPISTTDLEFIRGELDWQIEGRISYRIGDYRE